jgi:hypothetical protein
LQLFEQGIESLIVLLEEPRCPLALLTSSTTASGSELIASTLQKNERAVIVGETSSGLGKIQLVFPSAVANTTIKLTVAEFQAPAGTSIHGVGVVPDIELRAARVDPLQPRFFGPLERVPARARLHVFADAKSQNQPEATIWYGSDADALESIDVGEQGPRNVESDFALRLATDLVAQFSGASRSKQIDSVRPFLQLVRERELAALDAQLQALGIDWRSRPSTASDGPQSSDFAVKVSTDRAQNDSSGVVRPEPTAVLDRHRAWAHRTRGLGIPDRLSASGYLGAFCFVSTSVRTVKLVSNLLTDCHGSTSAEPRNVRTRASRAPSRTREG